MTYGESQVVPTQGRGAAWRLAQHLQEQMAVGHFPPGSRLPSYRELMEEHDLTSGTVSYAMTILSEQGQVERRHGSGVYVRAPRTNRLNQPRQTGLFALVVPEIESGLYLSLQAGMESSAQKNREQLITMTTNGNATRQADALLQLVDRDVSGIALVPSYEATYAYQLRYLRKANIPLVLLHRGVPDVPAPLIDIPFAEVGRIAGRAIGQQGHERVGAFHGLRSPTTELYLDGFRRGLQERGVGLDDQWVSWSDTLLTEPDDYSRHGEKVEQAIVHMLSRRDRPTAVFVSFDRLAAMVYIAAARNGLRVPADLSIVCFGEKRRTGALLLRLATVCVDEYETGRQAYELLAAMQRGERCIDSDERFTMSVSLDPAETLGPPPRI